MWKSFQPPRNCFYKDNTDSQTNTTQAQVNTNQTQVENSLISYNESLATEFGGALSGVGATTSTTTEPGNNTASTQTVARTITEDAGNPNTPVYIPPPTTFPSTSAIIGPSESDILANASLGNAGSWASEAANAVDPNTTGLLSTLNQTNDSDNADLVASSAATQAQINNALTTASASLGASSSTNTANGTQDPLGPQYATEDVNPADTTVTTASGGGSMLPIIGVGIVGIAIFFFIKNEHHKAPAE